MVWPTNRLIWLCFQLICPVTSNLFDSWLGKTNPAPVPYVHSPFMKTPEKNEIALGGASASSSRTIRSYQVPLSLCSFCKDNFLAQSYAPFPSPTGITYSKQLFLFLRINHTLQIKIRVTYMIWIWWCCQLPLDLSGHESTDIWCSTQQ